MEHGVIKRFGARLVAAALACASWGCQAQDVDAERSARDLGLGADFRGAAIAEFKAMGFAMDVRSALMGEGAGALPEWVVREAAAAPRASIFSVARGHGSGAVCWVGLRPERARTAPERMLATAAASFGAPKEAVWRAMFRHELGHCALAMMSSREGAPDVFMAEPFADVFGLDWARRAEPQGELLVEAYAKARRRVSGGAHGTWSELERWRSMPSAKSPCLAAWAVAPIDARAAAQACPRPG